MFEQQLIDELASKVADVVVARLNKPKVEQRYMKVEEAAVYTGYTVGALWKHIQRGSLPVSREGNSVRVDRQEIDNWMARNRQ
jgi:excisionase family DNA binding protein